MRQCLSVCHPFIIMLMNSLVYSKYSYFPELSVFLDYIDVVIQFKVTQLVNSGMEWYALLQAVPVYGMVSQLGGQCSLACGHDIIL